MLRMEYLRLDPEGAHWFTGVRPWYMLCGILQFTGEEAKQVGFKLPGGCGNYELVDHREDPRWRGCMPTRQGNFDREMTRAKGHLAHELRRPERDKGAVKRAREWINKLTLDRCESNYSHPTKDTPVQLRIWDVGDHHHSKFYATVKEADAELQMFLGCEPLTVQDLRDAGFFWVV